MATIGEQNEAWQRGYRGLPPLAYWDVLVKNAYEQGKAQRELDQQRLNPSGDTSRDKKSGGGDEQTWDDLIDQTTLLGRISHYAGYVGAVAGFGVGVWLASRVGNIFAYVLLPLIGIPVGRFVGVLAPRAGMVLIWLGLILVVLALIGYALDPAR